MIEAIQLLKNLGQFDNVVSGAQLPLSRLALMYAENGRGKTTLAAIFRSIGSGDPSPIIERRRLGALNTPHIVMEGNGGRTVVYQNGNWANRFDDIVVFDDHFVADNVCSGMEVATAHRQNLHELIIGAQGVALNTILQGHIDRIEQHNRDLQAKGNAIPAAARGALTVEAFCALEDRDDIDDAIKNAERNLAAARESGAVRQQDKFVSISLPAFDLVELEELLRRNLPDLEAGAVASVQAHLAQIGNGGEPWVSEGKNRIAAASEGKDNSVCPFCEQDLAGSPIIAHYQAYFSDEYRGLKRSIADEIDAINTADRGEIQAAFERAIRVAEKSQQFWGQFTDVPEVTIDTTAVALAWKQAYEAISAILLAKQSSPLELLELNDGLRTKVAEYLSFYDEVGTLSGSLCAINVQIDLVKEKAASADVAALEGDVNKVKAIKERFSAAVMPLCNDYLQEKQDKTATEGLRDAARTALNQYRENVFPAYETSINNYLQRFNAGFRLDSVSSVNLRAGSSCSYSVLINQVAVPLAVQADGGASFRNTLSAGDRNALALAFFFASLEQDPNRNQKTVVIDDPMTSLDEHRSLTTIQEMRRLVNDVEQVIVLSHSKPFLCALWEGANTTTRSASKIVRATIGSTLASWDVNQDCITEHDRRHTMVREYIENSVGADERAVAAALRPVLESFMRVAYPQRFVPGTMLGRFIALSRQLEGTNDEIMSPDDRVELDSLREYSNQFHHDTNAAWQTAVINDQQLLDYSKRTLKFACR